MQDMHGVYQFTGIPVSQLMQLDIYTYRVYLINAYMFNMSLTDEGIEKLNRYKQLFIDDSTGFELGNKTFSGVES